MADDPPVLLLPPEITSLIFGLCLPSGPRWPSPHEAPLLLAQICRQWRDICVRTPGLWESISFDENGSVQLLKECLSRAGNRPLTLSLEAEGGIRAGELMEAIIPHCLQWKDVHLVLPMSAYVQLSSYSGPFPMLRRLDFVATTDWDEPELILIRDAPFLRDARVTKLPYHTIELPLEQLTTLHFNSFSKPAQAMAALQRCPHLLDLAFSFPPVHHLTPPVQLRSLQSLAISSVSALQYLTVPRLERLFIAYIGNTEANITALKVLRSQASCDLQFLGVGLHDIPPALFRRFLLAANSIVHLKLLFTSPVGFRHHIEVLADPNVLPRLKHLEISDSEGEDHYGPLLDTLRKRAVLESFRLSLNKKMLGSTQSRIPPDTVMTQFRALAEAGLKLQISAVERRGPRVIFDTLTDGERPLEF
ncbi:hypothetical protein DFH09DRAFT_1172994 [Mycena vulgaris]|nr:hypothetical protein DFH09DRAFT_1206865 [Mycena vulgaris]KAJ6544589.1 hypothetical protein DFH09DRAFT_1172994 [Mycena vulgaris]